MLGSQQVCAQRELPKLRALARWPKFLRDVEGINMSHGKSE